MFIFFSTLEAQIRVENPSFEDKPSDATTPQGWFPCERGTTPDILPGFWGVYNEPFEGDTYVGIITRQDGSWESFGQRLSDVVTKDVCYEFSIRLAHSNTYANFNKPIKLRVYIGKNKCDKGQLIFESPFIKHLDWKPYLIDFVPEKDYQYIILEAFYQESNFSHKGNILMDNMSIIRECRKA